MMIFVPHISMQFQNFSNPWILPVFQTSLPIRRARSGKTIHQCPIDSGSFIFVTGTGSKTDAFCDFFTQTALYCSQHFFRFFHFRIDRYIFTEKLHILRLPCTQFHISMTDPRFPCCIYPGKNSFQRIITYKNILVTHMPVFLFPYQTRKAADM